VPIVQVFLRGLLFSIPSIIPSMLRTRRRLETTVSGKSKAWSLTTFQRKANYFLNPLNAQLNSICHLLPLLRAHHIFHVSGLTLNLLTWRIWWAPNNASRWQMGFNCAFEGLRVHIRAELHTEVRQTCHTPQAVPVWLHL